jgi:hypothetical protein
MSRRRTNSRPVRGIPEHADHHYAGRLAKKAALSGASICISNRFRQQERGLIWQRVPNRASRLKGVFARLVDGLEGSAIACVSNE